MTLAAVAIGINSYLPARKRSELDELQSTSASISTIEVASCLAEFLSLSLFVIFKKALNTMKISPILVCTLLLAIICMQLSFIDQSNAEDDVAASAIDVLKEQLGAGDSRLNVLGSGKPFRHIAARSN